jgi:hypothetical protein
MRAAAAYVEHAGLARFFAVQWSFFCGQGKGRHAERMKWNLWNGKIEAGRLLLGLNNVLRWERREMERSGMTKAKHGKDR